MAQFIWICERDPSHYYAAPDWTPDNPDIHKPQLVASSDGPREKHPRVDCPYCRTLGFPDTKRICHVITGTQPVRT